MLFIAVYFVSVICEKRGTQTTRFHWLVQRNIFVLMAGLFSATHERSLASFKYISIRKLLIWCSEMCKYSTWLLWETCLYSQKAALIGIQTICCIVWNAHQNYMVNEPSKSHMEKGGKKLFLYINVAERKCEAYQFNKRLFMGTNQFHKRVFCAQRPTYNK